MDTIIQSNKKFNLKCKYHQDKKISFINVQNASSTQRKVILCDECLATGQVSGKLVTVKSILNVKNISQINNWPFFSEEGIEVNYNQRKDDMSKKVIQQFGIFKKQFNDLIDELLKKVINSIDENVVDVQIEEIQKISQISEFAQILMSEQGYEEIEQVLQAFFEQCSKKFKVLEQDLFIKRQISQYYGNVIEKIYKDQDYIINKINQHLNSSLKYQQVHIKSLIDQLKFTTTNFKNCSQYCSVLEENNKIKIGILKNSIGFPQIVSNMTLDKNLKYIIRVEIAGDDNKYKPMIGLIKQQYRNLEHIFKENMCFYKNYGIKKIVKGRKLYEQKPNEIEIYISISEKKLFATDYPHHENVNSLEDINMNMNTNDNLQIAFSSGNNQFTINYIIKEFYTVNEYPNW